MPVILLDRGKNADHRRNPNDYTEKQSNNPGKKKFGGWWFIILPILEYAYTGGVFGNAGQYGVNLVSLIIMYCVIFNEKSQKLIYGGGAGYGYSD